jgi:hypothetical protein
MDTWVIVLIVVGAIVIIGVIAWVALRKRRTGQLREQFGSEYDRTVTQAGKRRAAESDLRDRQERHDQLEIRPLQPAARDRYAEAWRQTQARFVDDPGGAVSEADRLVIEVMRERGYPMEDFDQRSADISVDHPHLVENYQAAHAISLAHDQGKASTEDLRQAMVHCRSVFEELLETDANVDGPEVG